MSGFSRVSSPRSVRIFDGFQDPLTESNTEPISEICEGLVISRARPEEIRRMASSSNWSAEYEPFHDPFHAPSSRSSTALTSVEPHLSNTGIEAMNGTLVLSESYTQRAWVTGYVNETAEPMMTTRLSTRLTSVSSMLTLFGPFGCDAGDSAWRGETMDRSPSYGGGQDASGAASVPTPLELTLHAPDEVPAGEPIPFHLSLRNKGGEPIEVELGGEPITFDLLVTREDDGSEVWRRMEGYSVEEIVQVVTVAPGASVVFADVWSSIGNDRQWVAPGSYRVQGVLPVVGAIEGWATETRTLRLVP